MTVLRERVAVTAGALEIAIKLTALDCATCGVIYAIPDDLEKRARADGSNFYCPNGHSQVFTQNERDKLREKLRKAEAERDRQAQAAEFNREAWGEEIRRRQEVERSLSATKGQVTKLRKRATAGVCPFGCRRHFTNVERHVATQHPGQTLEGES